MHRSLSMTEAEAAATTTTSAVAQPKDPRSSTLKKERTYIPYRKQIQRQFNLFVICYCDVLSHRGRGDAPKGSVDRAANGCFQKIEVIKKYLLNKMCN